MRASSLTLMLLCFLPFLGSTLVSANSPRLNEAETKWLQKHKSIRVSGPQSFPPFQLFDDENNFTGMAADYLFYLGETFGFEVEVAAKQPWPDILQGIREKKIDVLSCASETENRKEYLLFSTPHLSFPLVIISKKDGPFISDIESLHHRTLALVRKNMTVELIKKERIATEVLLVDRPLEALQAVSLGNADAAIENLATATFLIDKFGLTNLKVAAPTSYQNYSLSIAIRKDWPELLSILNKGLASMSQEQHNAIRQRWMSIRFEHGLNAFDIVKWVAMVAIIAIILISIFYFSNKRLADEIEERKQAEEEKEKLIQDLTKALEEIKILRGILPICSSCKKIRDDGGYWTQIEQYLGEHTEADFSHSLCPDCIHSLYKDQDWYDEGLLEHKA